ncbi:MAG: hypothetical protein M3R27_06135 [Bacteroidota bacterium]|nr:hypothetical protein [Bacteroidota bacterium]
MDNITSDKTAAGKPKLIDNYLGLSFPAPALIGGYFFLILGLIALLNGHIVGLLVATLGGFVCFTFSGVQINSEDKTLRQYTSYFGFKKGAMSAFTCN